MNATGSKNEQHLEKLFTDPNFVAQEKFDGMRAIVHVTKTGLRIFSRNAGVDDPTRPLEKTAALPHLAELTFPTLEGTILDAEILLPGNDAATLSGTIHRRDNGDNNTLVKLFIFDILRIHEADLTLKTQGERILWLRIPATRMVSRHIMFPPWAYTTEEKKRMYQSVLTRRGEGLMFKRLDATYVQGGRPANNWIKFKKSAEFDCIIIGFTKGQGKYNQHIGAVRFGQYVQTANGWKLQELGQASGMSDQERRAMSELSSKYIGKVVRIKGMERLKSGAIRHPIYAGLRHDKNPEQCRWYQGEQ